MLELLSNPPRTEARPAAPVRTGPARASLAGALALLALASCGDPDQPRWTDLTSGFEPTSLPALVERWESAGPPTGNRLQIQPDGLSIEHELAPEDWRGDGPGQWSVAFPGGAMRYASTFVRLKLGERRLERRPAESTLEPEQFAVDGERLRLRLPEELPAPAALLVARLENGRKVEGSWQARLGPHCGTAIPVWSGEREELTLDLPPESRLSCRFAFSSLQHDRSLFLRVTLNGQELLAREVAPAEAERSLALQVPLPRAGARGAALAFEVSGPTGLGLFFAPRLGPGTIGRPGQRPWQETRPDIVLFLADTFRADNLAVHGGDAGLAPHLDALADESLCFLAAHSVAAWTLPAVSTLLTGLYPGQHGAVDEDLKLTSSALTLPEWLGRHGYRCGAVTDANFVSTVFGLEQGFEWFSEHYPPDWNLDRTLEEALDFLRQDDGRPVFLLVHTYRVHQPYRVGPDEDPDDYEALVAEARDEAGVDPTADEGRAVAVRYAARFRELYQAGVRDLDAGLGGFLAALETDGFPDHGYLVFTADHGEALGENDDMFHGYRLWESKLRIPLLIRGPGLPARRVSWPASLVDLPVTLSALAGLPPAPEWLGTSLLELDRERPTYAFQLARKSRQLAVIDQGKKVMTTPDEAHLTAGRAEHAYDLALDPHEENDLSAEPWPGALLRRLAPRVEELLRARSAADPAQISAQQRQELQGLGYGGGAEKDD